MENQPVYEEFGSVLLLVSTIKHRFELQSSDLNGLDPDSFTSRYFRSASESRTTGQLSEHENDLLGGWVRGLFEAEGINDELMSTCKPAEFYLLIATLFDQSIKACQSRTLTMETLKGGFECRSFSFSASIYVVCSLLFHFFLHYHYHHGRRLNLAMIHRSSGTFPTSLPPCRSYLVRQHPLVHLLFLHTNRRASPGPPHPPQTGLHVHRLRSDALRRPRSSC